MVQKIITGFHAIEERVLKIKSENIKKDKKIVNSMQVFYSKTGPRVKKILEIAKECNVPCNLCENKILDDYVKDLPTLSQDHRGIVLVLQENEKSSQNIKDFDLWLNESCSKNEEERQLVVILDSITDPHNVGAIIRSCDQFGANLVILPEHRSVKEICNNEIVARSSAGSVAWVPVCIVNNLVRVVQKLKENGFWVYGADAGGQNVTKLKFAKKTVLIMGSEGSGIARLLQEQCDSIVSIPTCGKIDSLNVSVAAGVLLYENYSQSL